MTTSIEPNHEDRISNRNARSLGIGCRAGSFDHIFCHESGATDNAAAFIFKLQVVTILPAPRLIRAIRSRLPQTVRMNIFPIINFTSTLKRPATALLLFTTNDNRKQSQPDPGEITSSLTGSLVMVAASDLMVREISPARLLVGNQVFF